MDNINYSAWACFFDDGQVIYSSVARTQKVSIRRAKECMGATWKKLKSRGIRCKEVQITHALKELVV